MRIDPQAGTLAVTNGMTNYVGVVDLVVDLGDGKFHAQPYDKPASPYNYSDMTGFNNRIVNPGGEPLKGNSLPRLGHGQPRLDSRTQQHHAVVTGTVGIRRARIPSQAIVNGCLRTHVHGCNSSRLARIRGLAGAGNPLTVAA
jgi:hypothetical protein